MSGLVQIYLEIWHGDNFRRKTEKKRVKSAREDIKPHNTCSTFTPDATIIHHHQTPRFKGIQVKIWRTEPLTQLLQSVGGRRS